MNQQNEEKPSAATRETRGTPPPQDSFLRNPDGSRVDIPVDEPGIDDSPVVQAGARAEDIPGFIGAIWDAHDEWDKLSKSCKLSSDADYAEWIGDAALDFLRKTAAERVSQPVAPPPHQHNWREKERVTVPNPSGMYLLKIEGGLWERTVPSAYSECECGDSLISPASSCLLCGHQKQRAIWDQHGSFVCVDCRERAKPSAEPAGTQPAPQLTNAWCCIHCLKNPCGCAAKKDGL